MIIQLSKSEGRVGNDSYIRMFLPEIVIKILCVSIADFDL